jgi:hypothetical protein
LWRSGVGSHLGPLRAENLGAKVCRRLCACTCRREGGPCRANPLRKAAADCREVCRIVVGNCEGYYPSPLHGAVVFGPSAATGSRTDWCTDNRADDGRHQATGANEREDAEARMAGPAVHPKPGRRRRGCFPGMTTACGSYLASISSKDGYVGNWRPRDVRADVEVHACAAREAWQRSTSDQYGAARRGPSALQQVQPRATERANTSFPQSPGAWSGGAIFYDLERARRLRRCHRRSALGPRHRRRTRPTPPVRPWRGGGSCDGDDARSIRG